MRASPPSMSPDRASALWSPDPVQPSSSCTPRINNNNPIYVANPGKSHRRQMIKTFMEGLSMNDKHDFLVDLLKSTDRKTVLSVTERACTELDQQAHHPDAGPSSECHFDRLPEPIILNIFTLLEPVDLYRCMRVCQTWKRICLEQSLWKSFCSDPERYRLGSKRAEQEQLTAMADPSGTFKWKSVFEERLRLWRNWHAGRCVVREFLGHTEGVSFVQFDQERIVSAGYDNSIRLWDRRTNCGGLGQMTLNGHVAAVRCLHLHNGRLASGSADKAVRVWDLSMTPNWSHVACRQTLLGHYDTVSGHNDSVLCLQYRPDSDLVCSGSADRTVRFWDPRTAQPAQMINNSHVDAVTCLRFDGNRLLTASVDSTIKAWDMRNLKCLYTIDWRNSEGHTRVMWRVSDGERICTLQGHVDGVTCVQFDDKLILSSSFDRTVRLWDFSIC